MARGLFLGLALLGLAGCGRSPAFDVAYYAAHAKARADRVAACDNHPATENPADCLAAISADARSESRRASAYVRPKSRLGAAGGL